MFIDCDACAARGPACGDCVVTVLLSMPRDRVRGDEADREAADRHRVEPSEAARAHGDRRPVGPVHGADLDQAEQAAIAVLAGSGLVPPLRLIPRGAGDAAPADRPRATGTG